jgi:hypothetical protein
MVEKVKELVNDRVVIISATVVFVVVLVVLVAVFNHEKKKPNSPQDLVAAAFNQTLSVQEWKPGMGNQPFVYHPAGVNRLTWRSLPPRSTTR